MHALFETELKLNIIIVFSNENSLFSVGEHFINENKMNSNSLIRIWCFLNTLFQMFHRWKYVIVSLNFLSFLSVVAFIWTRVHFETPKYKLLNKIKNFRVSFLLRHCTRFILLVITDQKIISFFGKFAYITRTNG